MREGCLRCTVSVVCLVAMAGLGVPDASAAPPDPESSRYHVDLTRGPSEARVTAQVKIVDGLLTVATTGSWQLPGGNWQPYVKDLQVEAAGRALAIGPTDDGWEVAGGRFTGVARLAYTVALGYLSAADSLPRTARGYVGSNGFFTVTAPLFVHSPGASGPFVVTIDPPREHAVTVPWPEVSSGDGWMAPSLEGLTETVVAITQAAPPRVGVGDYTAWVVMLGGFDGRQPVVASIIRAEMAAAMGILPAIGRLRQVLVFFPDRLDTGEALEGSSVMSSSAPPTMDNVALWGKTLAHEFVHHWVGHSLAFDDWAAGQWFTEGATDYLASLAQYRAGVIDETGFLTQMRKHLHLYLLFKQGAVHDRLTLVEAGSAKAQNNAAVYDGGALAALCYDGMLREASDGRQSLATVVASLLTGESPGTLTNERLVREIAAVAGPAGRAMYDSAIGGHGELPLRDCFARFGYYLGVNALDVVLQPLAAPSDEQRLMRMSLRASTAVDW